MQTMSAAGCKYNEPIHPGMSTLWMETLHIGNDKSIETCDGSYSDLIYSHMDWINKWTDCGACYSFMSIYFL